MHYWCMFRQAQLLGTTIFHAYVSDKPKCERYFKSRMILSQKTLAQGPTECDFREWTKRKFNFQAVLNIFT